MLKNKLQQVLDAAHGQHEYRFDRDQYGVSEHWAADLAGDCEDFALWCRGQLDQQGLAADLVYCKTETGEGHLVLHVSGWILDNRHRWLQCQDDLPYQWISMSQPGGTWHTVEEQ